VLTNASHPLMSGPLTPDARQRLLEALAGRGTNGWCEVRVEDLGAALFDADVLARLREVATRGMSATVTPDDLREAVRFDHRLRDEARNG
jgi:hypothetical protein